MLEFQNPDDMDARSVRQYLIALMANLKQIKEKQKKLQEELTLWKNRINLAREKGRTDLEGAAVQRVEEITEQLRTLSAEEAELSREAFRMKTRLPAAQAETSKTVNTDLLLAELELLVGEPDTLSRQFEEEEAEAVLKELKKDMGISE
ncbi:MAG: hypothetical protein JW760_02145 [Spirochaetales bacterium]|nr:hypothetical protein [Spirochaetales bacterium]